MKQNLPVSLEFIYQVFALIVIVILVHAAYVAIIRPNADAVLAASIFHYSMYSIPETKKYLAKKGIAIRVGG